MQASSQCQAYRLDCVGAAASSPQASSAHVPLGSVTSTSAGVALHPAEDTIMIGSALVRLSSLSILTAKYAEIVAPVTFIISYLFVSVLTFGWS